MSKPISELTFAEAMGRVGDLPDLVTVPASAAIRDGLKEMAASGVSVLAVTSATSADKVIAIVGFHDAVVYLVKSLTKDAKMDKAAFEALLERPIDDLLTLDPDQESYRVYERDINDTIGETLRQFSHGLHRALITDVRGKTGPHIFSQSDVISYLVSHPESAPSDPRTTTLESLKLDKKAVDSISDKVTGLDGFRTIVEKKVLAVPVLDAAGKVEATLAVGDLRGITGDTVDSIHGPVVDFIKSRRFSHATAGVRPQVTAKSTLQDVMEIMKMHQAHRVWVVDAEGKPVGVVSMSDVIRAVSA
ncbi:hypothetical protein DFJ74DRAFT_686683 [Hyaloraphidium curvatum]|nr:hypothetical protein DFJ74DRAFT_686683 [Hyaloraphidium curvatum]